MSYVSVDFNAQRLQNPLIKEYTLNLIRVPVIIYIFKVYSLMKGFWSLWGHPGGSAQRCGAELWGPESTLEERLRV